MRRTDNQGEEERWPHRGELGISDKGFVGRQWQKQRKGEERQDRLLRLATNGPEKKHHLNQNGRKGPRGVSCSNELTNASWLPVSGSGSGSDVAQDGTDGGYGRKKHRVSPHGFVHGHHSYEVTWRNEWGTVLHSEIYRQWQRMTCSKQKLIRPL